MMLAAMLAVLPGLPVAADDFRGAVADDRFVDQLRACYGGSSPWDCGTRMLDGSDCFVFLPQQATIDDIARCQRAEAAAFDILLTELEGEQLALAGERDAFAANEGLPAEAVARVTEAARLFRDWRRASCLEDEAGWLTLPTEAPGYYARCLRALTVARIDNLMFWGQP